MKKTSDIGEQKAAIRRRLQNIRRNTSASQKALWDEALQNKLRQQVEAINAKRIHTYLPFSEEVNFWPTLDWMLEEGFELFAPEVLPGGRLKHRPLESLSQLARGVFNTQHPNTSLSYEGPYDMVVVPGLAFDPEGYRIGYGGGYYDRFLAQAHCKYTVALAYPFQRVDALPREAHDKPVAEILYP